MSAGIVSPTLESPTNKQQNWQKKGNLKRSRTYNKDSRVITYHTTNLLVFGFKADRRRVAKAETNKLLNAESCEHHLLEP
jgi:hypothetical protein